MTRAVVSLSHTKMGARVPCAKITGCWMTTAIYSTMVTGDTNLSDTEVVELLGLKARRAEAWPRLSF